MRRCVVRLLVPSTISFCVSTEEIETANELLSDLQEGTCPRWLEQQIKANMSLKDIFIESQEITGPGIGPEEELDFDL